MPFLLNDQIEQEPLVARSGSFRYDYNSLINCALGDPRDAFGAMYEGADFTIPSPRLPAPPYHFMTQVLSLNAQSGDYESKPTVRVNYDIPSDAWYFKDNASGVMPYAVLLEVALQPCGWLSAYATIGETKNKHLLFRNLDGNATQYINITPDHQKITTIAQLVNTSILGGNIIVSFEVSCLVDGELCYEVDTVFGFFEPEGMREQKGHSVDVEEEQRLKQASNISRSFRADIDSDALKIAAKERLLMIDRMVYFDPNGGKHNKGYIRGEKDVKPSDWYFKAHFYSDPVQPGSLGIEALIQLIQAYLLQTYPQFEADKVSFEPVILSNENEWHYRGQVTPKDDQVILDFDVEKMEESEQEVCIEGQGRLWLNGVKIYYCPRIGVRMKFDSLS